MTSSPFFLICATIFYLSFCYTSCYAVSTKTFTGATDTDYDTITNWATNEVARGNDVQARIENDAILAPRISINHLIIAHIFVTTTKTFTVEESGDSNLQLKLTIDNPQGAPNSQIEGTLILDVGEQHVDLKNNIIKVLNGGRLVFKSGIIIGDNQNLAEVTQIKFATASMCDIQTLASKPLEFRNIQVKITDAITMSLASDIVIGEHAIFEVVNNFVMPTFQNGKQINIKTNGKAIFKKGLLLDAGKLQLDGILDMGDTGNLTVQNGGMLVLNNFVNTPALPILWVENSKVLFSVTTVTVGITKASLRNATFELNGTDGTIAITNSATVNGFLFTATQGAFDISTATILFETGHIVINGNGARVTLKGSVLHATTADSKIITCASGTLVVKDASVVNVTAGTNSTFSGCSVTISNSNVSLSTTKLSAGELICSSPLNGITKLVTGLLVVSNNGKLTIETNAKLISALLAYSSSETSLLAGHITIGSAIEVSNGVLRFQADDTIEINPNVLRMTGGKIQLETGAMNVGSLSLASGSPTIQLESNYVVTVVNGNIDLQAGLLLLKDNSQIIFNQQLNILTQATLDYSSQHANCFQLPINSTVKVDGNLMLHGNCAKFLTRESFTVTGTVTLASTSVQMITVSSLVVSDGGSIIHTANLLTITGNSTITLKDTNTVFNIQQDVSFEGSATLTVTQQSSVLFSIKSTIFKDSSKLELIGGVGGQTLVRLTAGATVTFEQGATFTASQFGSKLNIRDPTTSFNIIENNVELDGTSVQIENGGSLNCNGGSLTFSNMQHTVATQINGGSLNLVKVHFFLNKTVLQVAQGGVLSMQGGILDLTTMPFSVLFIFGNVQLISNVHVRHRDGQVFAGSGGQFRLSGSVYNMQANLHAQYGAIGGTVFVENQSRFDLTHFLPAGFIDSNVMIRDSSGNITTLESTEITASGYTTITLDNAFVVICNATVTFTGITSLILKNNSTLMFTCNSRFVYNSFNPYIIETGSRIIYDFPTSTSTATPTPTPIPTPTPTPSTTIISTPTSTATPTPTMLPTVSQPKAPTPTATPKATATPTPIDILSPIGSTNQPVPTPLATLLPPAVIPQSPENNPTTPTTVHVVSVPTTVEVNTNADCDLQNLAKCTVEPTRIAVQRQTDVTLVVKAKEAANIITVDFNRGSIPTGSQVIVSNNDAADTNGLASAILSIEVLDLNFQRSNIQQPVEICFQLDSNIDEDEACIATANDSGEFECHKKCPDKLKVTAGGIVCDSVSHFTSFAVLFDGGEDSPTGDDCTSRDRWILGSLYYDLILILSVVASIMFICIAVALLFTFVTPLRHLAIGPVRTI